MEQLDRVNRYLKRIRDIYCGNNQDSWDNRTNHQDDVYSFFVHCYHLRDWVITLNKIELTKDDVDLFINSNIPLQICSDIANGIKHCSLKHKTRTGFKPHIAGSLHKSSKSGVESEFTIIVGTQIYDALEIAENCVSLWIDFIEVKKHLYLQNNFNGELC